MKLIEGNKYFVIESVKDGKIKTKEVIYDGELTDFNEPAIKAMIKGSKRMYYPYELFVSHEAAVKHYLANVKDTIKFWKSERAKYNKQIKDANTKIAEAETTLDLLLKEN